MPPTLLALDTSTEACSVALSYHDKIIECYELAPRQHTKLLLPMMEELLATANLTLSQIDALAFGCGPGSFTGLRVAASVTQGIAFAHDLPVIPVSTLRTIAQGCYREFQTTQVLVALDAAMQEIYYGAFGLKNAVMEAVTPELIARPDSINFHPEGEWVGAGSGWDLYAEQLQQNLQLQQWFPHRYPRARDMLVLAMLDYQHHKMISAEDALPVYLRDDMVKKKDG